MTLTDKLNLARNAFLALARRAKCDRPDKALEAVRIADAIEQVIDERDELTKQFTLLEKAMSAYAEAIRFERARAEKAEAALAAAVAAAPDADDQAELAKVAAEREAQTTTPVDQATASA